MFHSRNSIMLRSVFFTLLRELMQALRSNMILECTWRTQALECPRNILLFLPLQTWYKDAAKESPCSRCRKLEPPLFCTPQPSNCDRVVQAGQAPVFLAFIPKSERIKNGNERKHGRGFPLLYYTIHWSSSNIPHICNLSMAESLPRMPKHRIIDLVGTKCLYHTALYRVTRGLGRASMCMPSRLNRIFPSSSRVPNHYMSSRDAAGSKEPGVLSMISCVTKFLLLGHTISNQL